MKKIVYTDNAPQAIGPYSQAILVDGMLYCSGQIPIDPATSEMITGDVKAQTERVCENIKAVLTSEGFDFSDVIKTTCFLVSMDDFADFNEVYGEYFVSKPARSCVAVSELPKGAKVEVEVIARK